MTESGHMRSPKWLWLFGFGTLLLVLLPVVGLWLAYREPPGLFGAPPLSMDRIWPLLGRSLALSFLVGLISLLAGTWLAFAETRTQYVGRRILSFVSLLALATPSYVIATIVREQLAPQSTLGAAFATSGTFTGFWPAVLVLSVACTPYVHLLSAAALRRCPVAEEESARALGASTWRVCTTIIAPRLRPTWAFALVLVSLYVVSDFGAVAVLDCEVLTWELYKARDGREAIAIGFGLLGVVIPLLAAVRLLHGRTHQERSVSQREPALIPMSTAALCLTWLIHLIIIGVGVLLPALTLTGWLMDGLQHQFSFAPTLTPAMTTLLTAGVGAFMVVIAAGIVSWMSATMESKASSAVENAVYVTSSLPGILVAVGILKLIIGLKREAPSDLWLHLETAGVFLLAGYTMRFLSQGYAAIKPSILRLDAAQIEAARSLGANSSRAFRSITLPAIKPSMLAAYALVFLSIAKELPITLMLIPLGHTTLAYRIFDGQQEASLPDVGLAGMTLLAIAFTLQILLNRWRGHV